MPVPSTMADLSTTASLNSPSGGDNPSSVDDYLRAVQAIVKTAYNDNQNSASQWATVTGTDTIIATLTPAITAYQAGQSFKFVSAGANTTTAVTINVNALGAKNVTKNGSTALAAGDIQPGAVVTVTYDGTKFQAVNLGLALAGAIGGSGLTQSTSKLLGRTTAGTGAPEEIAVGSGLSLSSGLLTATGGAQIRSIGATVAANALTISASALSLDFRSTTLGSGAVTTVSGTPANLVISSGSTLGTVNAVQSDIVVLAINNAGTIELAAVNLSGGNQLDETNLISTTAEGGAGAADSANVIYSTTARTNVAYRVLGIIRSTQTTAGTWATAPSLIQGQGGQALATMSSLGFGQIRQDLTASRALSTTYYNTTGKPIFVEVGLQGSASAAAGVSITVNGVVGPLQYMTAVTGGSHSPATTALIPPAASYSATSSGGASLLKWIETR